MAIVRYWGRAREVSGTSEQVVPDLALGAALDRLRAEHGPRMIVLLQTSSLLLDGVRVAPGADRALTENALLEVLPPYAGG